MIGELISGIFGILFIVALFLYLSHHGWFVSYLDTLAAIVSWPLGILWYLLRHVVKAILKTGLMVVLVVLLAALYLITWIVPTVGGRVERLTQWLDQRIDIPGVYSRARRVRVAMAEIVAANDEHSPEFETVEQYIDELEAVRERSARRLEIGESVLSLGMGAAILFATIAGMQLFQARVYGVSATTLIEFYLIVVAVSILYRIAILDLLSFTGDEDLETIPEWDAALSYQRAVSLVDVVQLLTLVLVIGAVISKVSVATFETVLRRKYAEELSVAEWISFTWQSIHGDDKPREE